jgi:HD-GYP domain-containing protein (c-di-GMP phosphodiesterase class II)
VLARVLSVVDVYDALTTERPYKRALPSESAVGVLRDEAAKGWLFSDIVEAFIGLLDVVDFAALIAKETLDVTTRC